MLEAFYHRHRRLVKCAIAAAVVVLIYIGAGFLVTLHPNYKIYEPREVFLSRFDMTTVKAARVIHSEHPFLYITRGEHPYGSLFGVITDDSIRQRLLTIQLFANCAQPYRCTDWKSYKEIGVELPFVGMRDDVAGSARPTFDAATSSDAKCILRYAPGDRPLDATSNSEAFCFLPRSGEFVYDFMDTARINRRY